MKPKTKAVNFWVDEDVHAEIVKFSADRCQSIAATMRQAVQAYLNMSDNQRKRALKNS